MGSLGVPGLLAAQESSPNVLIILLDDLGYGDLSCYGQKAYVTPRIDSFAAESVMCTNFYVPTPYCAPSRATLLTGRFPLRHGLKGNPTPDAGIDSIGLSEGERTLAEVFQEKGYRTGCIGKWHLGHIPEYFPSQHGFEYYQGILYSNDMRPVQLVENGQVIQYPIDQRQLTQYYTNLALDYISAPAPTRPFFLLLSHAMPHKPLAASEAFYTPATPDDLYADVMQELDSSIGQLLDRLSQLKILEETIVVFLSDNGPWYGGSTGQLRGMKATNWEGGVRVPFIIRYPEKLGEARKVATPVWSPDFFPTLLSLTGIVDTGKQVVDGDDITKVLRGETTNHNPVFTMHGDQLMTVRHGHWKLFIQRPPGSESLRPTNWIDPRRPDGSTILAPYEQPSPKFYPGLLPYDRQETLLLFNLLEDPGESRPVTSEHPGVVSELLNYCIRFKAQF